MVRKEIYGSCHRLAKIGTFVMTGISKTFRPITFVIHEVPRILLQQTKDLVETNRLVVLVLVFHLVMTSL